MNKIFIVVQNLKIGGFQRIALDEAYGFLSSGYPTSILTLEEFKNDAFFNIESGIIRSKKLSISFLGNSRFEQFVYLRVLMKREHKVNFISHNLRATVLIRLARIGIKNQNKIFTIIHQLPTLSATLQRKKRFFYSLFTDKLFAYSEGVKNDWENRINSNCLSRYFFRKKQISVLRNGVYFERLPKVVNIANYSKTEVRLIFLGRNTSWKGIEILIKLAELPLLKNVKLHFILPSDDTSFLKNASPQILDRITFQTGSSLGSFKPVPGDIHVYPTNYGKNAQFLESVSINCLEMASIRIPSLVSIGGLETWPEFIDKNLIKEVDWKNLNQVAELILELSITKISDAEFEYFKKFIDIQNRINFLLKCFKN